ncbi:MAG: tripartite tricarboxylate transporter substrate binding protein, partial [Pseudomonadota bacterium]
FVHKDTPQEARDKLIAVAEKTMMSERAQKLAADTGAAVYWQGPEASAAQIVSDRETLGGIGALLQ